MSEENETLDSFIKQENQVKTEEQKEKIEDEFARLLNDFINQDKQDKAEQHSQEGLDSFLTDTGNDEQEEIEDEKRGDIENKSKGEMPANIRPEETLNDFANLQINKEVEKEASKEEMPQLKAEEQELARAVINFQDGVTALADKKNLKMPITDYNLNMLYPNYKPSIGQKIAKYLISCWDVINRYDPENMKKLPKNAGDEEYLNFAESLTDTDLQLSIISYIEILINMEICEVNYRQKKEILQKNRIKKELYEEYMSLQERKALFIKKLKEKNFPINVEKLIGNYFKAAQKDAEGAFKALTKNPAMFSPIEFEKIHPKFFGLIKVTPEDGIKANQKIGEFIKKLKV